MFGLEGDKKGDKPNPKDFMFELESDLEDLGKLKDMQAHILDKVQKIKGMLREGDSKEEYDRIGVLLHGYTSLLKVMKKMKTK